MPMTSTHMLHVPACLAAAFLAGPVALGDEPYARGVGNGVIQFFESEAAFRSSRPSWVLEFPNRPEFPLPPSLRVVPRFEEADGQRQVTIPVPEGASLYGLGIEPGSFLRHGARHDEPVSNPWILCVRADGTAFGVVPDTTWTCTVDLTRKIVIRSEAPSFPVLVVDAPNPEQVLVAFNEVSGRMEMPPRWGLGWFQEAGRAEASVRAAAAYLREERIPADALIVDAAGPLAFGRADIADPGALFAAMRERGFHIIAQTRPLAPVAESHPLYQSGLGQEAWVAFESGGPATVSFGGESWVLPDPTREASRSWWSRQIHEFLGRGVHGLWLAEAPWERLDDQARFRGDESLGGAGSLAAFRFAAPALLARATRDGFRAEQDDRRPVIVSAAAAPAAQRWTTLQLPAIPERADSATALVASALSATLSGQPMFVARVPLAPADQSRAALWRQLVGVATLMPAVAGTLPGTEFQAPPDEATRLLRAAVERRARLKPYLYTLAFYAFFRCEPIIRPVFFADPADASLRAESSMFLLGRDVLVVPPPESGGPKPTPPLAGKWRKIDLGEDHPDLPDLYLRPGAILPIAPVMLYADERPVDPMTILINLDEEGRALGDLYDDEGEGYSFYRNQNIRIRYTAAVQDEYVYIRLGALDGGLPIPRRKLEVRLLTDQGEVVTTGSERGTIRMPKDPPVKEETPK